MVLRRITRRVSRDSVLFISGLAGILHQTLVEGGERPTLLILFAAMIGLPAFLRGDEKSQQNASTPPVPAPSSPPGGPS